MKLTHSLVALSVATSLFCAQAAERPSLAKHEKRIGDLEIKAVEIEEELGATKLLVTDNKKLIDENKEALESIAVIEGPAGPRGPSGEDGALAGLNCQTGQFAQFDGLSWQCTQGTSVTPNIRHQECIRGYDFNIAASGSQIAGTSINGTWREACGLLTPEIELRGPIIPEPPGRNFGIATPMITQEISAPEIQLEGEAYSDALIGIYPHPVNTEGFFFTLVFISEDIFEDFVNWNISGPITQLEFQLRQGEMGLEIIFDQCHVDNFSAVPEIGTDPRGAQILFAKQTVTLDCGSLPTIEHADPLWVQRSRSSLLPAKWDLRVLT